MNQETKGKLLTMLVLTEEGELTPIKALQRIEELIDKGTTLIEEGWRQEEHSKLTFGELKEGDKFIGFPLPGDNSGHGGYKQGHVLFYKWPKDNGFCGKNFTHGTFSDFPDSMRVIKIV